MLSLILCAGLIAQTQESAAESHPVLASPEAEPKAPNLPESGAEAEPLPEPVSSEPSSEWELAKPAPQPAEMSPAARAMQKANALFDSGNERAARHAYGVIIVDFPGSVEAELASRILRAMGEESPVTKDERDDLDDTVYGKEPYSLKTGERLRINTWERIDFGATAFAYGASVGIAWLPVGKPTEPAGFVVPIILSSLTYTSAALAFMYLADPDRGDLPLVLGITSYIPTTAVLVGALADANADEAAVASAITGTIALPLALLLAHWTNLDPGDTQLTRDAGFWLGLTAAGAAGALSQASSPWSEVDGGAMAAAGLIGLWGGVGLGALAASFSEITLERVRVTTWVGYGGTGIGALIGVAVNDGASILAATTIGAALGLTIGFLATSSLDGLPEDVRFLGSNELSFLRPTAIPSVDRRGAPSMAFGLNLVQGRL